jgi:hypothetical protein
MITLIYSQCTMDVIRVFTINETLRKIDEILENVICFG